MIKWFGIERSFAPNGRIKHGRSMEQRNERRPCAEEQEGTSGIVACLELGPTDTEKQINLREEAGLLLRSLILITILGNPNNLHIDPLW